MKFKHNKKRNTFFLFESLIKEMTRCTISKEKENKNKVLNLLKRYFHTSSILHEELSLYKVLLENRSLNEKAAEKLAIEVKKDFLSLDRKQVFNTQTELINKINKTISKDVFENFVPHYKEVATIYQYFNNEDMKAKSRLVIESKIVDMLKSEKLLNEEARLPKIDNLTFKTFLQKYNSTYSSDLLEEQKQLLGNYITSFSDNGLQFKIFLNEEVGRLKEKINEHIDKDHESKSKLKEVLNVLEECKKQNINNQMVKRVLKIQNLMEQL
jgi:hypothetical protein